MTLTKKELAVLCGSVLLLVLAVAAAINIIFTKANALDRESKEYADVTIVAVISHWDIREFEKRASPELSFKSNDLEKLFATFQKLGKLTGYRGSQGEATISITTRDGLLTTAAYSANADFERGPANIQITLIKRGEQWRVLGFRINSRALLEPQGFRASTHLDIHAQR